jgi:hypothetical protein
MKATNDKNISNNFPKNLSQLSTGDSQKLARESENALHNKNEKTNNQNDLNMVQKTSCNNNTPNLNDENFIPHVEENLNNLIYLIFQKKVDQFLYQKELKKFTMNWTIIMAKINGPHFLDGRLFVKNILIVFANGKEIY